MSLVFAILLSVGCALGDWALVGTSPLSPGSLIMAAILTPLAWFCFANARR